MLYFFFCFYIRHYFFSARALYRPSSKTPPYFKYFFTLALFQKIASIVSRRVFLYFARFYLVFVFFSSFFLLLLFIASIIISIHDVDDDR